MKKLMLQKELTLIKQVHQKDICLDLNLYMLDLNLKHIL